MVQVVGMTYDEKVKIYSKTSKRKLIEMLIEANRLLELLNKSKVTIGPTFCSDWIRDTFLKKKSLNYERNIY